MKFRSAKYIYIYIHIYYSNFPMLGALGNNLQIPSVHTLRENLESKHRTANVLRKLQLL